MFERKGIAGLPGGGGRPGLSSGGASSARASQAALATDEPPGFPWYLLLLEFLAVAGGAYGSWRALQISGPDRMPLVVVALAGSSALAVAISYVAIKRLFDDRDARIARSVLTDAEVVSQSGAHEALKSRVRYQVAGRVQEADLLPSNGQPPEVGEVLNVRYDPRKPDWVIADGASLMNVRWLLLPAFIGGAMALGALVVAALN